LNIAPNIVRLDYPAEDYFWITHLPLLSRQAVETTFSGRPSTVARISASRQYRPDGCV